MSNDTWILTEPLLALAAMLAALAWSFVKSTEWYERFRMDRRSKAMESLEAAVEDTYRRYVRSLKQANGGGPLTEEQRHKAREKARRKAEDFGARRGVDVVREIGADYLDLWTTKLVQRLKGQ